MTLRATLPVVAACAALFGASFAAGNAILDDEDSPTARPARSSPPAETAPPPDARSRLALELGRAAGLPGLRTSPRPANRASVEAAPVSAPAAPSADAPPADTTTSAPSPVSETEPVVTPAPPAPPAPPPPTPVESSPPSSSAPGPDAAPSGPSPAPDPAPSGGAGYGAEGQ
jgi:hypothetical protein